MKKSIFHRDFDQNSQISSKRSFLVQTLKTCTHLSYISIYDGNYSPNVKYREFFYKFT